MQTAPAVSQQQPGPQRGFLSFMRFDSAAFLVSMVQFYQEQHGVILEPSAIKFPSGENTLGAGIVIAGGVTIEQDLAKIKALTSNGQLYRYTDQNIDKLIKKEKEQPRPVEPYCPWTAPAVEATGQAPHLAEKSYNDVEALGELSVVMNYKEYVRLAHWYLWATGRPLDVRTATLTSSLDADGDVLSGYWGGDRFFVFWSYRPGPRDRIRFRQVVLP